MSYHILFSLCIRKLENIDEMISSLLKSNDESFKHIEEDMPLKDTELLPEENIQHLSREKELRGSEARMTDSSLNN